MKRDEKCQGATRDSHEQKSGREDLITLCSNDPKEAEGERAAILGFTLTDGAAEIGGGAFCTPNAGVVSNCALIGNIALTGGGASSGTFSACTFRSNSAAYDGGGVANATLNHCVLTGNSAGNGGGALSSTLNNCLLTGNSARFQGGGAMHGFLYSCTITGNSAGQGGGVWFTPAM